MTSNGTKRRARRNPGAGAQTQALPQLMTPDQVALLLQLTRRTVDRLIAQGERTKGKQGLYPVYRLSSRAVRIPQAAVHSYLQEKLT